LPSSSITSFAGAFSTYLGGIGWSMPSCSLNSISEKLAQPSEIAARRLERMMPDTTGMS